MSEKNSLCTQFTILQDIQDDTMLDISKLLIDGVESFRTSHDGRIIDIKISQLIGLGFIYESALDELNRSTNYVDEIRKQVEALVKQTCWISRSGPTKH